METVQRSSVLPLFAKGGCSNGVCCWIRLFCKACCVAGLSTLQEVAEDGTGVQKGARAIHKGGQHCLTNVQSMKSDVAATCTVLLKVPGKRCIMLAMHKVCLG